VFFTVHTAVVYVNTGLLTACSQALSKPVWHTPLLCVQWKTPDDGQRNCLKHVEFYSKNKFEKSVHLVGFIMSVYKNHISQFVSWREQRTAERIFWIFKCCNIGKVHWSLSTYITCATVRHEHRALRMKPHIHFCSRLDSKQFCLSLRKMLQTKIVEKKRIPVMFTPLKPSGYYTYHQV
jgi:hypothetical protein